MNTNLDQSVATIDILRDEARTLIDRYDAATKALNGIELSLLAQDAGERVEFEGVRCNRVLEKYSIQSSDDLSQINDVDAQQLVSYLLSLALAVRDSAIETIMARLHHHRRQLPVAEIETARRHKSLFTPILLQELQDHFERVRALSGDDKGADDDDGDDSTVPFFAFLLMFEWNVVGAVPLILDSLHLSGQSPFLLYGDIVHEFLHRYLAHFVASEPQRIASLVRDTSANLYVRWVACKAFDYMARDETMTRVDTIDHLARLFSDCRIVDKKGRPAAEHCFEVSGSILESIYRLGGNSPEIIPDTDEVWNFVDSSIISRQDFYLTTRDNWPLYDTTRMENCLDEIKHWSCFERPREPKEPVIKPKDRKKEFDRRNELGLIHAQQAQPLPSPEPQPATPARVGRNELCPCGSGKKYKKCCLREQ